MAAEPKDPRAPRDALGDTIAPPSADPMGATVRRSAVTETVVPAALDETVLPAATDALGATVRRSAVTDTVPPPAALETLLPAAGTDDTLAAAGPAAAVDSRLPRPAGDSLSEPAGGSSATLVRFDPEADTLRTVGDELRQASIDRFGDVDDDRFEVLSELARGGLGQVLRARDPRTGRIVAIKQVLRPNRELIVRFAREALVTANLQHPSIVPVYEVGRWHGGEPYYAMKLVRGRALDALIAEAGSGAARVALVPHVIAVADALAYAHSEHVIHRDLKPANVLVGPYGETVVIDWGLARDLASDDDAPAPTLATAAPGETVAGAVMGTPSYMAPEQATGQLLDERADVYAIGALLYHVLAGVRPYDEQKTVDGILAAVEKGPPHLLAALAPDAAPELIAIAGKAMARDRAARYPTARELAEDLRRFQAGQLVGAHRYSSRELVRRWLRRHRAAAATAAIAAAALAVFGVVSFRRIAHERDRARAAQRVAERERAD
ncbi:MAG TPA: protein kinase, partial [Kofleriaceae bacterium]|nr:protein kinase [Kofleriaceae bacterium]